MVNGPVDQLVEKEQLGTETTVRPLSDAGCTDYRAEDNIPQPERLREDGDQLDHVARPLFMHQWVPGGRSKVL